MKKIRIFTDGGSRGNPGQAACATVIKDENNNLLLEQSRYLGETTNNQAEYQGVLLALEEALKLKLEKEEINFYLDSELVVKQLKREYKIKDPGLQKLFIKVWNLLQSFSKVTFTHVPREKNKEADLLVNQALDSYCF